MTWWDVGALELAPPTVRKNGQAILDHLARAGVHSFPVLRGVNYASGGDCEEYLFDLGRGVTMPVSREVGEIDPDFPREAIERAVAAEKLSFLIAPQAEHMARSIRRLVSNAQIEGLPVRTLGVDLAEYGYWTDPDEASFHVGIHILGHNLAPATHWLLVESDEDLERGFANAMATVRDRRDRLAALGLQGADGTIDELALHAVKRQASIESTLRALRDEQRLELDDGTVLMWTRGHVSSGDGGDLAGISWTHDRVTLHDVQLPETVLISSVGKPITRLVEHASLSDAMIVKTAQNAHDERAEFVEIQLLLPHHLIDTVAGRVLPAVR